MGVRGPPELWKPFQNTVICWAGGVMLTSSRGAAGSIATGGRTGVGVAVGAAVGAGLAVASGVEVSVAVAVGLEVSPAVCVGRGVGLAVATGAGVLAGWATGAAVARGVGVALSTGGGAVVAAGVDVASSPQPAIDKINAARAPKRKTTPQFLHTYLLIVPQYPLVESISKDAVLPTLGAFLRNIRPHTGMQRILDF